MWTQVSCSLLEQAALCPHSLSVQYPCIFQKATRPVGTSHNKDRLHQTTPAVTGTHRSIIIYYELLRWGYPTSSCHSQASIGASSCQYLMLHKRFLKTSLLPSWRKSKETAREESVIIIISCTKNSK